MQPVEQLRVSENFASFNDGQFVYFLDQFVMLCLTEAPNREHIENNRLSIVLHFPNLFFFSEEIALLLFTSVQFCARHRCLPWPLL